MFYKLFFVLVAISILASCSIEGSFRGLYSYYKVTEKNHPSFIQSPGSEMCSIKSSEPIVVYTINGHELKNCLQSESYAVVYFWSPSCPAEVCIPPNYFQEYCNTHNFEGYIVALYYDYEKMAINYNLDKPIFGINTKYYKTNLTKKYNRKFREDLLSSENLNDDYPRFLLFKSDSLIASSKKIEDLVF